MMRSKEQDQIKTFTFAAAVADAASGSGIANGVVYSFTRTGTGVYLYSFSTAIIPISFVASPDFSGANQIMVDQVLPGSFRVACQNSSGSGVNSKHYWICLAIDKRA